MEPVTIEIATAEIDKWLDAKKVPAAKRAEHAIYRDRLIGAVMDGSLVVNDDLTLTQNLVWPIEVAGKEISELKYKQRITADEAAAKLRQVPVTDADGRVKAFAAAACDMEMKVLGRMDSGTDYGLASAIAVFFTP